MKKNIFFVIFATISSLSFSQNQESEIDKHEERNYSNSFILKAGANFSLYTSEIAKWEGNVSYQLGIGYEIPLSEKFYIQPELNYFRLNADAGKKEIWRDQQITIGDELRVSIIAIPLIFKYNIFNKFDIELGPQLNYISNISRTRNDGVEKEKVDSRVNNFDFGITGGLSYNITQKFGANLRYYFGLTEVDERPGYYLAYTDADLGKMSFASLSLFYKF